MSKSQQRKEQKQLAQRSNYISSLMQSGMSNKDARERADKTIAKYGNSPSENVDRSSGSVEQDWASQESDF